MRRFLIILGAIGFAACILFWLFLSAFGINPGYRVDLSPYMKGSVIRADGTREPFTGNHFPSIHKGDSLEITVDAPPSPAFETGVMLCYETSNAVSSVTCGDRILLSEDLEPLERGIMPMKQFIAVSLPETYVQDGFSIRVNVRDRTSTTAFSAWLSPGGHAAKSLLCGREFSFVMLLTLITITFFLTLFLAVLSFFQKKVISQIHLSMFCLILTLWNFSANAFYYLISDSLICSQGEYIAIYASAIPLSIYMGKMIRDPLTSACMKMFSLFFLILFVVVTIINFSPIQASYSTYLMILHAGIFGMIVVYFISLFRDREKKKELADHLQALGFQICMCLGLLEVIRFNLINNLSSASGLLRFSLAPIAITELVITMVLSACYKYGSAYMERLEKERLEILAYQDPLTHIPNRSACYRGLDQLISRKQKDFCMLFFDLNYLKKANDEYGHEVGDRMLKLVAEALKSVFEGRGFYGRWGGDEFLACIEGKEEEGRKGIEDFYARIHEINSRQELPFPLSTAAGMAVSTSSHPIDPIDAVNRADDAMYAVKKEMKAVRNK